MAPDDEDSEDLYDDEFDFVDDDDDDDDEDDESDLDDDSEVGTADEDRADEDNAEPELDDEPAPREAIAKRPARDALDDADESERDGERDEDVIDDDVPVDEYSRPELPANFRVHVYEFRQYKRTIDRPFTAEDAEAFASEYNRTSKPYGRFALAGKEDAKPKKALD